MSPETKNNKLWVWFSIVLIVAVLLRLVMFFTYPQVTYSDTHSYRRAAEAVLNGFQAYDGTRTPGYPVFMALVGTDQMVYAVQLFLGLLITLAFFYIGWKLSDSQAFGAAAALAHTLNVGQLFFEANLLTETLTTFWLVLALLGTFIWLKYPHKRSFWLALGIGLSSSLAVLTRPLFIFIPIWLTLFLMFTFEGKRVKVNWQPLVAVMLPAILLIGGWMSWVNARYQVFNLTTMGGFHLVQHTGYYFEDVPDEDAVLRDTYLKYRDARIKAYGTQGNTIWDAIPELQEVSGLGFYDLSRTLQGISIDLIKTHPGQYLKYVLKGWWFFWRAPVYWSADSLMIPALLPIVKTSITASRVLLFGINLLFILSSLLALVWRRLCELWRLTPFMWLLAGSVWATSVLQTLLDHGDNPRFLVPLQSVAVFWVLWIAYQSLFTWRQSRHVVYKTS